MAHSFKITVKDDLSSALENVEKTICDNGGKFSGNTESGNFVGKTAIGKVKGSYVALADNEIEVTITKKPMVAPHSKIESAIRNYFA